MHTPQAALLLKRRFGPIFVTQFLGAFNDNLYRSALLFSLSFGVSINGAASAALLAAVAGGVFILPYFLFSGLAGQLADRIDKAYIARLVKLAEVAIMILGGIGLVLQSIPVMLIALFAMGAHSTFFGPVKYAILPQHLSEHELMAGTGMVEAGTFLSILLGQIAGGILHHETAAMAVLVVAAVGLLASLAIPPAAPAPGRPALDRNPWTSTKSMLMELKDQPGILPAALGIAWFFALGGVLTQEMVPLARHINAGPGVAVLFLSLFSVGVAIGSMIVARLLQGKVDARYVPTTSLVIALAILDLSISTRQHSALAPTVAVFLADPNAWRIMADILAIAISGGIYIVPLYAILQTLSRPAVRSQTIAASNILNAIAMVSIASVAALLAALAAPIPTVFLVLGIVGMIVSACFMYVQLKAIGGEDQAYKI